MVPRGSIPDYWIWMYHGSWMRYALEALVINEVDGINFQCPPNFPCPIVDGSSLLSYFDMDKDRFDMDVGILAVMYVAISIVMLMGIRYLRLIDR